MDYELAKQLREKRFPGSDEWIDNDHGYFVDHGELIYEVPTLSELIEAVCTKPRHTFSLDYDEEWAVYEEPNEDGPWSARYYDITPVGFYERGAKTPEEAVAKLWLALNVKPDAPSSKD